MNKYEVAIRTKKSFRKGRFDGIFGFFITIGNFMDGHFDSRCHTELDFMDVNPDPRLGQGSWSAFEGGGKTNAKACSTCPMMAKDDTKDCKGCKALDKSCVGFSAVDYNKGKWETQIIDVRDERLPKRWGDKEELRKACINDKIKGYDITGCVGQAVQNKDIEDLDKYFCSEAVGEKFNMFDNLSPAQLAEWFKELFK